jgi:hypothetical protein
VNAFKIAALVVCVAIGLFALAGLLWIAQALWEIGSWQ